MLFVIDKVKLWYHSYEQKKSIETPTVTASPRIPESTYAPVKPSFQVTPSPEPVSPYPSFISKDALVMDGTEVSRAFEYEIRTALENKVSDFWLKNYKVSSVLDFNVRDYGLFWVKSISYYEQTE